MSDQLINEQNRIEKIAKDTKQVEAKYQKQQSLKRQKKLEKEQLSQRWVAPLILILTMLLGFLVSLLAR
jgi:hypothetical protein